MATIAGTAAPAATETGHDGRYERRVVLLLGLAFGLVGLDRWMLGPLFPLMAADLKLNYADLGTLFGALALTWGAFSVLGGRLSDRIGRRPVVIPAIAGFSLLSGFTGLAGSMGVLVLIRVAMGATEGAFCPSSVAAVGEASHPRRRGLNQGLQMMGFPLFGFGFAPIIATQLLAFVPSWREVFMLVCLPGLVLAWLVHRVLRDAPRIAADASVDEPAARWGDVVRSRNVLLAAIGLFAAMSCVFVLGAMVPNYLTDTMHLPLPVMGFVASGLGWGGFLGQFVILWSSDWIGRRPAAILSFAGALGSVWLLARTPAEPLLLFVALSASAFFSLGLAALFTGPVASEAVPAGQTSSAIGIVSGTGEIFGGGIAPLIAGFVAQRYGLAQIFWVPLAGLSVGLVVSVALLETSPRRVAARARAAGRSPA